MVRQAHHPEPSRRAKPNDPNSKSEKTAFDKLPLAWAHFKGWPRAQRAGSSSALNSLPIGSSQTKHIRTYFNLTLMQGVSPLTIYAILIKV
jgi:hypothetical protein